MVDRHDKVLVATMRITTNTTPTHWGTREYWLNHLVVVIAAGKRPASIPNLEAKPASADGTAPGRVWESRTPPQHSIQRVGPGTRSFQAPPAFYARNTRIHDHTQPTSEHTPNPNHTLPVSVGSIRVRNGANTHALCSLAYSPFVISYEALDPVLCRVLSDERVLAAPLLQMALESFIRLIR